MDCGDCSGIHDKLAEPLLQSECKKLLLSAPLRLGSLSAMNVLGLQALIARGDVKNDFFTFHQGLVAAALDGSEMNEHVLTGILCDKAKPLFVIEPLNFATGHSSLLVKAPEQETMEPQLSAQLRMFTLGTGYASNYGRQ
jgi:hypothetical protein